MTPEEQNRAVAEVLGRRYHSPTEDEIESGSYYQYEPNFCGDLNLCHEMWHSLDTKRKRIEFSIHLRVKVVSDGGHATSFNEDIVACVENATAPQRVESFLRTHNLWKD